MVLYAYLTLISGDTVLLTVLSRREESMTGYYSCTAVEGSAMCTACDVKYGSFGDFCTTCVAHPEPFSRLFKRRKLKIHMYDAPKVHRL